jgi:hypothetical protein
MPEISRFYGIVISINYKDHNPPHFHAKYGEFRASFRIQELNIMAGELPDRALSLVLEWAFKHRDELYHDWQLAEQELPLEKIEPLK